MSHLTEGYLPKRKPCAVPPPRISPYEERLMGWVMDGWTLKEMAGETGRPLTTVYNHLRALYGKLGAKNAPHAVSLWLREGR